MISQSGLDFVDFKDQVHLSVISLACLQTYIFTDGEDEVLKKKIGKFYEGGFMLGTEMHIVLEKCLIYEKPNHSLKVIKMQLCLCER